MTLSTTSARARSCGSGHRGFTLLELLVGLTLLSVLALVLYSAFWLGMRSWQAAAAHHEDTENMRVAVDFLHNYLSNACPLLRREDAEQRLQFEGEPQRVLFVTDMPAHLGIAGLYEVVLELIEKGDDRELIATRTLLHPDLAPSETETAQFSQRAVLARGLKEARFAYFGEPPTHGSSPSKTPDEWQDQWIDAERLPTLVSLEVTPRLAKPWPRLVLRLHVDGVHRDTSAAASLDSLESEAATRPDSFFSNSQPAQRSQE
jgi:general secretion pathway protein J